MSRVDAMTKMLEGLTPDERVKVIAVAIETMTADALGKFCVPLFARVTEIAKSDPYAAGRLAAALYAQLAAHRPQSPAPLDDGFVPTEPVPTREPGGGR